MSILKIYRENMQKMSEMSVKLFSVTVQACTRQ